MSFALQVSADLREMKAPGEKDLRLLREACDPEGYFLARKVK
jgi:glutaconate CoA-transferase subunit B